MTHQDRVSKLSFFELRLAWGKGRIFGDILPDHPKWGPIPDALALADLVLQVVYLPSVTELFNRKSPLREIFE